MAYWLNLVVFFLLSFSITFSYSFSFFLLPLTPIYKGDYEIWVKGGAWEAYPPES